MLARSVVFIAFALSLGSAGRAEEDARRPTTWHLRYNTGPSIALHSSPPAAEVALAGPSQLGGTTPLRLPGNLKGTYRINAFKPGFAYATTRVEFVPGLGEDTAYPIAAPPSLLSSTLMPPGALEWQGGERQVGASLFGAELAAVAGAIWSGRRADTYRQDATANSGQGFLAEIDAYRSDLRRAAWEKATRQFTVAAAGLWAVSIVSRTGLAAHLDTQFDGGGTMAIQLPRAGRGAVIFRSALLPGWGQRHAGRLVAGRHLLTASMATGLAALLASQSYDRAAAELRAAEARFDYLRQTDVGAAIQARTALDQSQTDSDRAHTARLATLGLTAGLWAYNLFDAWVFTNDAAQRFGDAADAPQVAVLPPVQGRAGLVIKF